MAAKQHEEAPEEAEQDEEAPEAAPDPAESPEPAPGAPEGKPDHSVAGVTQNDPFYVPPTK